MDKHEVDILHREINAALRPILERHGLDLLPSTLTHDNYGFRKSIKAVLRTVPVRQERIVGRLGNGTIGDMTGAMAEARIKAGNANPGPAFIRDPRSGRIRPVFITERKRTKYGFYFTDEQPRRNMLGHFALFTTEAP